MQFVRGLLLGVAGGAAVATALDVYRPLSTLAAIAAFVVFIGVSAVVRDDAPGAAQRQSGAGQRGRDNRSHAGSGARGTGGAAGTSAGPRGFFAGRRLGDALAWLGTEHGLVTLDQVRITDASLAVVGPGPQGQRMALVTDRDGVLHAELVDVPPGDARLDTSGRFTARDLAPDVLARALDRARRERPDSWSRIDELTAIVDQPDRLRGQVTLQLHHDTPEGAETLWVSAAGEILYVQGVES